MIIDKQAGIIEGVRFVSSPHYDLRPDSEDISLLVIHGISLPPGQFGGDFIEQLFLGRLEATDHPYFKEIQHLQVSAHVLIRRTGELVQFVPFHRRAWHAGQSCFQGRKGCNDFAIGVELEGTDEVPYTEEQYHVLASLTQAMREVYPGITRERIVGHSDIAPGRKTDPGSAFDWAHYCALMAGGL